MLRCYFLFWYLFFYDIAIRKIIKTIMEAKKRKPQFRSFSNGSFGCFGAMSLEKAIKPNKAKKININHLVIEINIIGKNPFFRMGDRYLHLQS